MESLNLKKLDNVELPNCFIKQERRFNYSKQTYVKEYSLIDEEDCKLATIVITYNKFYKKFKQIKFEYVGAIGFYLFNAFYIQVLKLDKEITEKYYGKEIIKNGN